MRKLMSALLLLTAGWTWADTLPESMRVYPTPREVTLKAEQGTTPKAIAIVPQGLDADAARVLGKRFQLSDDAAFKVTWKQDASLPKEGYTLELGPKGASIVAADGAGFFYAAKTLNQLMASGTYTAVQIKDAPVVPFRGTVEGFYGLPWSFESRKSQFRFYGDWKMNTYIYGPKDDPYHGFSTQWRDPYPEAEGRQIAELVRVAKENKVNFVWAVHPGRDIHWTDDSDMKACVAKFEMMYQLGVRSFAVFFDDIGGEGARAEKQVELLNYVNRNFVRVKGDVTPLILCPTQYNRAWSGGNYLDVLGQGLDKDIMVMWTGNSVCTDISKADMEWINNRIGRKAYIWWNWPVSDYVRPHLLLGKAYGIDKANGPLYSGFVSNPMDKPEASKIGLFGIADYTWNPEAYNPDQAWRDGIKRLFPRVAEAAQVFADHNSDQGQSVHGYRREESVLVEPAVQRISEALAKGGALAEADLKTMEDTFKAISQSAKTLREQCRNNLFMNEVGDWIDLFGIFGETGLAQQQALSGAVNEVEGLRQALRYRAEKERISKIHAAKPFQTNIEVATRVLVPYLDRVSDTLYTRLWTKVTGHGPKAVAAAPTYRFITNVPALSTLQVSRDDIYVKLPEIFEPKTLQPGEWIGIELPRGVTATWVHFKLDNAAASRQGRIQLSRDFGQTWGERATVVSANGEMEVRHINKDEGITAARYINTSDKPVEITLRQFKVDVPKDATANVSGAMTDNDLASGYTLQAGESITVPLTAPVSADNTCVLAVGPLETRLQNDAVILQAGNSPVTVYEIIH